jgi:hypothetical protein
MPDVLRTGGWDGMRWDRLTEIPRRHWRISVIDGSALTPADASRVVLQWIRDVIAGRAPVFRRR